MATAGESSRIPVVLLSGFLGAGKTTLLNHLLRNNRGIRIGVVVNDFGSVNIDSMMVAGQVDSMVALGNGCICCAVDVSDMDSMFDTLADRRMSLDVIVVEASGIAEPRSLIRMVLASANPRITYGGLVGVVDAVEFDSTRSRHPEIEQHLHMADLVVLNKTDRLTPTEAASVTDTVRAIVGDVPIMATRHGRVDASLLFDVPDRVDDVDVPRQMSLDELLYSDDDDDHSAHLHTAYSSVSFSTDEPLDPRRFIDLLENPAGEVYRTKGFAYFGVDGYEEKYVIDTVGRHIRVVAEKWDGDEPRVSRIVLIGTDVDEELVEVRLLDCVRRTGDPTDSTAMLPVHRYSPQSARG